jgi:hypothetical protein
MLSRTIPYPLVKGNRTKEINDDETSLPFQPLKDPAASCGDFPSLRKKT